MKTYTQWNENKLHFQNFVNAGDEICEALYDYFLGVVPPEYFGEKEGIFCSGEPVNHDRDGNPMYHTFKCVDNRYWYLGYFTIAQAKNLA